MAIATAAGCAVVPATVLGIEAAIVHNFAWHDRWTWRDRPSRGGYLQRLIRYNAAMACSSLLVGALVTWVVVHAFRGGASASRPEEYWSSAVL